MNCTHEFVKIKNAEDIDTGKEYIITVCYYCGQVRHVYLDGRVEVVKQKGEVIHK